MNLLPEVFVKVIATTQAQCVDTPDFGTLSEERAALSFKGSVVGPPCDLMRVMGYVLVHVVGGLSRSGGAADTHSRLCPRVEIVRPPSPS
jgi:hypothetical protein